MDAEFDKEKLIKIITGLIILLSLILLLIYILRSFKKPIFEKNIIIPTPTKVENVFKRNEITPIITPSEVIPATQTGAFDQELPLEEKILTDQKMKLKTNLPLILDGFRIEFDYSEDKFIVYLEEPKAANQVKFLNWLQENYSAIPKDRFIFK